MRYYLIISIVLLVSILANHVSYSHPNCWLIEAPATHNTPPLLCPVHIQQAQKTAKFEVEYEGYTDEARSAFEFAVDIMERIIVSDVPIVVRTKLFEPSITNILGGGTSDFVKDFPGSEPGVWYPSPLADALTGVDQNPDSFDIEVLMNRNARWYFGTDGDVPVSRTDFVSVVLHELGHGLGFGSGMEMLEDGETNIPEAVGQVSYGLRTEPFEYFTLQILNFGGEPILYDNFLVNGNGQVLTDTSLFPNPSQDLTFQTTSENLFFAGANAVLYNKNVQPEIFAPHEFANGSSISHLDERLYGPGHPDALMTPSLQSREVVHDVGTIFIGVLQDMGWQINPEVIPTQSALHFWEIYE